MTNFHDYAVAMSGTLLRLTQSKNHDYAGTEDVYSNFRMCQALGISTTDGFLTRMCDKISRIKNFQKQNKLMVVSEKITDTMCDLANYAMLLSGYMGNRQDLYDHAVTFFANTIESEVEEGLTTDALIQAIESHMQSVSIFIKRSQMNAAQQSLRKIANYSLQLAYATENMGLVR